MISEMARRLRSRVDRWCITAMLIAASKESSLYGRYRQSHWRTSKSRLRHMSISPELRSHPIWNKYWDQQCFNRSLFQKEQCKLNVYFSWLIILRTVLYIYSDFRIDICRSHSPHPTAMYPHPNFRETWLH
jgi:hypothetical protein